MAQSSKVTFFILLLIIITVGFLSLTKKASAEIATPSDWLGIFPVDTGIWANTKADSYQWLYSATCNQTAAGPSLSGSCNLNTSTLTPGAYELRYNANNTDAMLSESKVLWTGINLNATVITCSPTLTVALTWPSLVGITTVQVERSQDSGPFGLIQTLPGTSNTFTDNVPYNPNVQTTYSYRIDALTSRATDSYSNTASISSINGTCNPDQTNASCHVSSSPIVSGNFTNWVAMVSGGDNNKTFTWSSYVNAPGTDPHTGATPIFSQDTSTNPTTYSSVWNVIYNTPGTVYTTVTITDLPYSPVVAQCSATSIAPTPPSNFNVSGDVHSNGP